MTETQVLGYLLDVSICAVQPARKTFTASVRTTTRRGVRAKVVDRTCKVVSTPCSVSNMIRTRIATAAAAAGLMTTLLPAPPASAMWGGLGCLTGRGSYPYVHILATAEEAGVAGGVQGNILEYSPSVPSTNPGNSDSAWVMLTDGNDGFDQIGWVEFPGWDGSADKPSVDSTSTGRHGFVQAHTPWGLTYTTYFWHPGISNISYTSYDAFEVKFDPNAPLGGEFSAMMDGVPVMNQNELTYGFEPAIAEVGDEAHDSIDQVPGSGKAGHHMYFGNLQVWAAAGTGPGSGWQTMYGTVVNEVRDNRNYYGNPSAYPVWGVTYPAEGNVNAGDFRTWDTSCNN